MGAANLAERFPDMYIMAPQAPGDQLTAADFERLMKAGNPFDMRVGKTPDSGKGARGWNRDYLSKICKVIRGMISNGKVDPKRVYVTGMSMGGGGTLRILSVDPDLFTAAAPICPSMNGETYMILNNVTKTDLWLSTAYIDHQPARHVYLTRAYQKLLADGNIDVRLTIYTPEELAEYGIGCRSDLTYKELLAENHNSWTLTLHNEYGILGWLVSKVKS
jgi:predicted peptidase